MERIHSAIDISLHFGVAAGKLRDNLQQFLNIDVIFLENILNMFTNTRSLEEHIPHYGDHLRLDRHLHQ